MVYLFQRRKRMQSLLNLGYGFCLFTLFACSENDMVTENEKTLSKEVVIDVNKRYQSLEGFGASDCWMPSYVGKTWMNGRTAITELLFSSEIDNGEPKGIGLSQWRVNLGGGTAEQGDNSGIEDKSRRAESYLTSYLTYDWERCEGQRYFMAQAREFGCKDFILFSNTPPVQYTYNGKGFSNQGAFSNLKEEHYGDFADYMAEVAAFYTNQGYRITHISPVNEPQYNWEGGQEGSGWTNEQVARLVRNLDSKLTEKGLDTDILVGEAGNWKYLYQQEGDKLRGDVMSAFFSSSSSSYIGNLSHVKKLICGHSYWTDGTWDGMREVRQRVAEKATSLGLELWQTEWSMLGEGYDPLEFVGFDVASEMDIALYMSKVIYNDLTVAGVSSWCYWTAMDIPHWGHKNRFLLISLLPGGGEWGDIEQEGSFRATSNLWVLGNYSRFIRPQYRRVSLEMEESRKLFGTAWLSPLEDIIVAVYTNLSEKDIYLKETYKNQSKTLKSIKTYTTNENKNLEENSLSIGQDVVLSPKSVMTVVYTFE